MRYALEPGSEFAGHRIEAEIGRGGMAIVYRARHLALDRVRALKLLAPELADDPTFVERFRRESRLAAAIEHPNVVTVHHAGRERGLLYLALRFVDGFDLARLLEDGPLRPERAVALLGGLAAGLDAVHAAGLVHRDVKPANALIEAGAGGPESIYLSDFGISRLADEAGGRSGERLTETGAVLGTADYIAPEQVDGAEADPRADIYAFACVAFHALGGRPPFERPTSIATLAAHGTAPRPRLGAELGDLGESLDRALVRGMAIEPAERPATASELAAELAAALGPASTRVGPPDLTSGDRRRGPSTAAGGATTVIGPEREGGQASTVPLASRNTRSRSRVAAIVAAALLAAGATAVAVVALAGGSSQPPGPGPAPSTPDAAGSVVARIEVARGPVGVDVNPKAVWVASRNGGKVRAIDPGRNRDIGDRLAVDHPRSVTVGFGSVWALRGDAVVRFAPGEGDDPGRAEPVVIGGLNDASDITVDRRAVWISDRAPGGDGPGRVVRVDPMTNRIDAQAAVGRDPRGIDAGRGAVWVANRGDASISEIDPKTVKTRARPIAVGTRPSDLVIGKGSVWVVDNLAGQLYRVDTATRQAGAPIPTGARPRGVALGYGSVWVAAEGLNGSVWRHSAQDGSPIGDPIKVGPEPVDIDTGAGAVWTAGYRRSKVVRIDPGS